MDCHDGALLEIFLYGRKIRNEKGRLLRGSSGRSPAEENNRGQTLLIESQQRTEVSVGRDDDSIFGRRELHDRLVSRIPEADIANVNRIVPRFDE